MSCHVSFLMGVSFTKKEGFISLTVLLCCRLKYDYVCLTFFLCENKEEMWRRRNKTPPESWVREKKWENSHVCVYVRETRPKMLTRGDETVWARWWWVAKKSFFHSRERSCKKVAAKFRLHSRMEMLKFTQAIKQIICFDIHLLYIVSMTDRALLRHIFVMSWMTQWKNSLSVKSTLILSPFYWGVNLGRKWKVTSDKKKMTSLNSHNDTHPLKRMSWCEWGI
jgi:hypothetical protein